MTASTTTTPPRTKPRKPIPPLSSAMMLLLYPQAKNIHRAVLPLASFRGYQLRRHGHVVEVKTPFNMIAHQKEGDERDGEGNTAEQQTQNSETILVRHVYSALCLCRHSA